MLDKNAAALNALSPFGILSRGYSIVSKDKSIIRSADELDENDVITVRFSDSSVTAEISSITRKEENI
jgi:exodeoxyribonuclease VII large subunit